MFVGLAITSEYPHFILENTAPDQIVDLISGTGILVTGTYPNFTVTNVSPNQVVTMARGTGILVTGSYPNFVITNISPNQAVSLTAGTGMSVGGAYPNFTVTNSAPDQTVSLTAGANVTITGAYPNFTIASSAASSLWTQITDAAGRLTNYNTPTTAIMLAGAASAETLGVKCFFDPNTAFFYTGNDTAGRALFGNRGTNSFSFGRACRNSGTNSLCGGWDTFVYGGNNNFAMGFNTTYIGTSAAGGSAGQCNLVFGENSSIRDTCFNNMCVGRGSFISTGCSECTVLGHNHTCSGAARSFQCGSSTTINSAGVTNCFLFNASMGTFLTASAGYQVSFGAQGGYRLFSNSTNTVGVELVASGNAWSIISDQNLKQDLVEANYQNILDKVQKVPVYHYRFKGKEALREYHKECGIELQPAEEGVDPYQDEMEECPMNFGCMAQDWNQIFPCDKKNPLSINTNEVMFSAIACIKALKQTVDTLREEVNMLKYICGMK